MVHFSLRVLRNNPGENNDGEVLEEFTNLSFDPDNINYLPRAIGDRYVTIDSNGKLTYNGDYPNKSVHIYISDYESNLEGIDESLLPHGFQGHQFQVLGGSATPSASFVTAQTNTLGVFDSNVYYGWDFSNDDNKQYLSPIPASAGTGSNVVFSLENMLGSDDATTLEIHKNQQPLRRLKIYLYRYLQKHKENLLHHYKVDLMEMTQQY